MTDKNIHTLHIHLNLLFLYSRLGRMILTMCYINMKYVY